MFLKKIVLALMAFIVFSLPLGSSGAFGAISLGSFGLLSMIGILAFLAALAFLLFGRQGLGTAPVPWDPSLTLFSAFVAFSFASVGWAVQASAAISASIAYAQLLVFVWLLVFLRSEKGAFSVFLHSYLFGALVVIAQIVLTYGLSGLLDFDARLRGAGRTANDFAYMLVLAMPIALYLFQQGRTRFRWLYLSYLPAAAFLVILSASRTGFVLMVVALLVGVWPFIKVEHRGRLRFAPKAVVFLAVIVVFIGAVAAPHLSEISQPQVDRIATLTQDETAGGRVHLWVSALSVYLDNPLFGVGSGGGRTAAADYRAPDGLIISLEARRHAIHNSYLGIAAETGTLGLLLYLAALGLVVLKVPYLPRNNRLLFVSMMSVSSLAATTLSLETQREFYLAFFLPLVIGACRGQPSQVAQARPAEKMGMLGGRG